MLTDVFIELHVPDFRRAIEFYSRLGFQLVWRTEDYLVMRRGKSVISFYGDSPKVYSHSYFGRFRRTTKRGYAVEIILPVDRVKQFYSKVRGFATVVRPLQLKKWGRWDFRIVDPFGFYLRITERYSWTGRLSVDQRRLIADYKMRLKESGSLRKGKKN